MLEHARTMARYNRWANARLLEALAPMSDEDWHREAGTFFPTVHRTLNHLLVADRTWLARFRGDGWAPTGLDMILHDERPALVAARAALDDEIVAWVDTLDEQRLAAPFTYTPVTDPRPVTQPLAPALMHVFNHQTHHRGQLHALATRFLGVSPALDLVYYLRDEAAAAMGDAPC